MFCLDTVIDIMIGIDEAGRGPVLGSLIYAAAIWMVRDNEKFSSVGLNDSKQLNEKEREKLHEMLFKNDSIGYVIDELTSQDISTAMLKRHPISLNEISYQSVIKILSTVNETIRSQNNNNTSKSFIRITKVFIDTVGDPEYYKSRLRQGLGQDFEGT